MHFIITCLSITCPTHYSPIAIHLCRWMQSQHSAWEWKTRLLVCTRLCRLHYLAMHSSLYFQLQQGFPLATIVTSSHHVHYESCIVCQYLFVDISYYVCSLESVTPPVKSHVMTLNVLVMVRESCHQLCKHWPSITISLYRILALGVWCHQSQTPCTLHSPLGEQSTWKKGGVV